MMSADRHERTEKWRQEDEAKEPSKWSMGLFNEILFARIGVGRDPLMLAREMMRRIEDVSTTFLKAMAMVRA
jgi:hypothetical protein